MAKKLKKNEVERTRVITAKITIVERMNKDDGSLLLDKNEIKKLVGNDICEKLNADDVTVTDVKDFILGA